MQELAPVLLRVSLALQYRKDWPTPIMTQDFQRDLAMLTLGGTGYVYTALNQDIHGNFVPTLNVRPIYSTCIIAFIDVGHVLMSILQYITSAPVIRIFINEWVPKIAGKAIPSKEKQSRSYFTGSFL